MLCQGTLFQHLPSKGKSTFQIYRKKEAQKFKTFHQPEAYMSYVTLRISKCLRVFYFVENMPVKANNKYLKMVNSIRTMLQQIKFLYFRNKGRNQPQAQINNGLKY